MTKLRITEYLDLDLVAERAYPLAGIVGLSFSSAHQRRRNGFGADTDAGSDAGVTPTDGGSSGAPMAGTRCTFAGGLPNGPLTLRVEAPGYVALERAITAAELTQPTGCGFAVSLSVRLRAQ